MTKLLTEKWKDGELPHGFYYLKSKNGFVFTDHTTVNILKDGFQLKFCYKGDIESVLAPVPSYDEWQSELASNDELLTVQKRLEKQLEIATKALQYYADGTLGCSVARQAIKEMEGVK